ncbi:MAG: Alpha/beta hydrolase fold [Noviherbaspirillum sp.]|nr:Alpha/beta hydrolase fold [Noviherbaspirillum sp.]
MEITIRGHKCVYDWIGEGPHLTLLHSVGLSTREGWRNQIEPLSRHFKVLSYDFRGLGQSETGTEPVGIETFTRDLEALLQALGVKRTALMGVSLGGMVSQTFAIKHPEVVSALVLTSTACQLVSGSAERLRARNERIKQNGMAVAADPQLISHFTKEFGEANPDVLAWYKSHYMANDPDNYMAIMEDNCRFDISTQVAAIRAPTLIVAGALDDTSVAGKAPLDSAKQLNRLIPGSELLVVPGAKHYPQIDQAEFVTERVLDFLKNALANEPPFRAAES